MTRRHTDNSLLFSGTSHPELAKSISEHLAMEYGHIDIKRFPDGEVSVELLDSVRGRDVYVVQSIALKPDEYLMELLIIIDAMRRASAQSISVVIPYFGYSRQDRKDKPRVPITAKLVADLLSKAGTTRLLTMDLHAGQIQGFFDVPVDNLYARTELVKEIAKFNLDPIVVVAPDTGSAKLARAYASLMGVDFAIADKHRCSATQVETTTVIGDVRGKNVLLADDMCSTGGTLVSAAYACQERGAERIIAAVTHGLFVGNAVSQIEESPIEKVFFTDSIPNTERLEGLNKASQVSCANLFAHAIRCIILGESISSLYPEANHLPSLA